MRNYIHPPMGDPGNPRPAQHFCGVSVTQRDLLNVTQRNFYNLLTKEDQQALNDWVDERVQEAMEWQEYQTQKDKYYFNAWRNYAEEEANEILNEAKEEVYAN